MAIQTEGATCASRKYPPSVRSLVGWLPLRYTLHVAVCNRLNVKLSRTLMWLPLKKGQVFHIATPQLSHTIPNEVSYKLLDRLDQTNPNTEAKQLDGSISIQ
jgi:hypothetical protein